MNYFKIKIKFWVNESEKMFDNFLKNNLHYYCRLESNDIVKVTEKVIVNKTPIKRTSYRSHTIFLPPACAGR